MLTVKTRLKSSAEDNKKLRQIKNISATAEVIFALHHAILFSGYFFSSFQRHKSIVLCHNAKNATTMNNIILEKAADCS